MQQHSLEVLLLISSCCSAVQEANWQRHEAKLAAAAAAAASTEGAATDAPRGAALPHGRRAATSVQPALTDAHAVGRIVQISDEGGITERQGLNGHGPATARSAAPDGEDGADSDADSDGDGASFDSADFDSADFDAGGVAHRASSGGGGGDDDAFQSDSGVLSEGDMNADADKDDANAEGDDAGGGGVWPGSEQQLLGVGAWPWGLVYYALSGCNMWQAQSACCPGLLHCLSTRSGDSWARLESHS
jgi:hypothetical protein